MKNVRKQLIFEAEGCMHLQYYFYPERTSEEQTAKTLVIDVYFSEEGIEYMGGNQFRAEYAHHEFG